MQYEMPMQYIARITAQANADYAIEQSELAIHRAQHRARVDLARSKMINSTNNNNNVSTSKHLTWHKVNNREFVSSRGGWRIIKHENDGTNIMQFELLRMINDQEETIDFYDTLGGCKQRVRKYK